jgi:hypothetical protein
MWKPALFLITIVLVTPNGRELLSEYARRGSSLFAMSSTYAELALIAMALVVVGLFARTFPATRFPIEPS